MPSTGTDDHVRTSARRDFLFNVVGSGFGLGLSPFAPGSLAALLGVLYEIGVDALLPYEFQFWAILAGLVAVIAANHVLTPWAVRYWNDADPRHFVLDEIAGYLMVPLLFEEVQFWETTVLGFLLFRVLDVIKIPPARQIDRHVHGPWGIVLDDVVSGGYAAMVLYGLRAIGVLAGG